MKKHEKRGLSLRTETISNLSSDKLRSINGGWTTIMVTTANEWTTIMSGTLTLSGTTTAGSGGGTSK